MERPNSNRSGKVQQAVFPKTIGHQFGDDGSISPSFGKKVKKFPKSAHF
jgi:hypothetical protein